MGHLMGFLHLLLGLENGLAVRAERLGCMLERFTILEPPSLCVLKALDL